MHTQCAFLAFSLIGGIKFKNCINNIPNIKSKPQDWEGVGEAGDFLFCLLQLASKDKDGIASVPGH